MVGTWELTSLSPPPHPPRPTLNRSLNISNGSNADGDAATPHHNLEEEEEEDEEDEDELRVLKHSVGVALTRALKISRILIGFFFPPSFHRRTATT